MTVLIGLPACARMLNGHLQHATPARYAAALMGGSGAVPVMIPPVGEAALAILPHLHGLSAAGQPQQRPPRPVRGRQRDARICTTRPAMAPASR